MMTIGTQATSTTINNTLTQYAIQLRDICQDITNLQQYLVTLGTAGIEALGYDPADAASVQQMASYLATIAGVFAGTATQASEFNFGNALSGLYAGG
jgi:hypothetical protein